jgi:para-nitrobenzyl esterase
VSASQRLPLGTMSWQPSAASDVPEDPLSEIAGGMSHDIPLLIGTTRDEWKMFTATDGRRRSLDEGRLRDYMTRSFERDGTGGEETMREAFDLYRHTEESGEARSLGDIWNAFQTDRVFRHPAIAFAEGREAGSAPTYLYRFDWAPAFARSRIGACHSIDVPFGFGTIHHPALFAAVGLWASARETAAQVQRAWITFARGGSAPLPDWPAYDCQLRRTRILGPSPRIAEAPDDRARAFWSARSRG